MSEKNYNDLQHHNDEIYKPVEEATKNKRRFVSRNSLFFVSN